MIVSSTERLNPAQVRFLEIIRRHVDRDDIYLTDDQMVRAVMDRYRRSREQSLIDPNE